MGKKLSFGKLFSSFLLGLSLWVVPTVQARFENKMRQKCYTSDFFPTVFEADQVSIENECDAWVKPGYNVKVKNQIVDTEALSKEKCHAKVKELNEKISRAKVEARLANGQPGVPLLWYVPKYIKEGSTDMTIDFEPARAAFALPGSSSTPVKTDAKHN